MAQLVECPPSTQDVAGSNPARGSSFFLLGKKKELSSGVVVYLALSLRMSLHIISCDYAFWDQRHAQVNINSKKFLHILVLICKC